MYLVETNWPYPWYGIWREMFPEVEMGLPSVFNFLDKETTLGYDPHLYSYLAKGVVVEAITGFEINPFTGEEEENPLILYTDGVWIWTNHLSGHIQNKGLIIPNSFYRHIENQEFKMITQVKNSQNLIYKTPYGASLRIGQEHLFGSPSENGISPLNTYYPPSFRKDAKIASIDWEPKIVDYQAIFNDKSEASNFQ